MKIRLELKWAAILFLVTMLWMFFEKMMGWHGENIAQHAIYTNIYDILFAMVFAAALHDKKSKTEGSFSWKQGFTYCIYITVIIAAISPLTQTIIHKIISPEYFPNIISFAVDNDFLTQEAAESNFNLNSYIIQNFIGTLILGAAVSLILPLFFRRR